MSVLNKMISYYPSKNATTNGVDENLLNILQTKKHESIITALRNEANPDKQKEMKEKLPCYTVAGLFKRREEAGLFAPSGLAAIDLDSAEDYDIFDLLNEFKKLPYIAYTGLSCRGKRLFCIIPFLQPDKYLKHYERLIKSFEDIGLPMGDTCHKQVSQPRFVSFNTEQTCFYNHSAKPYHLLPIERSYNFTRSTKRNLKAPNNPFNWCEDQINKSNSFAENQRHPYLLKLVRYCNLKGIPQPDTLTGCLKFICPGFEEPEINKIVEHTYKKHADSFNKLPFLF